ncbi:MAG: twin-arginine translocase subunit TatC [Desulfovibrionaceae bacterium]|nr:twin-arginine translocase subunit TatC [Desulfovibrionaceae bacterium]
MTDPKDPLYFPEDERSPLEQEDDHSYTDFDLHPEIESRLGPAKEDPLAASREVGQAYQRLIQEPKLDPAARAAAARNVDALGVDDDCRDPLEGEQDTDDEGHGLVMCPPSAPFADADETGAASSDYDDAGEDDDSDHTDHEGEDEDEDDDDDDEDEEEEEGEEDSGDRPMTLRDHLNELRKRLMRSFIIIVAGFLICWPFAETHIFPFLFEPLVQVMPEGSKLIFTSPPEAFFTYMKIAFVAGIFLTSPLVFYQIWAFIAPGLYKEEKVYILPVAFFSALFFISGAAFCYYVVFDFIFTFFMSYNQGVVQAMPKLNESLTFVLQLLLAFGLVFELPLFVFFLARLGLITAEKLRAFRRYAVLLSVIVGALLTPPDVISQLLMAAPLLVLYEISIIIAATFGKKKKEEPASEDEDEEDEEDTAAVRRTG